MNPGERRLLVSTLEEIFGFEDPVRIFDALRHAGIADAVQAYPAEAVSALFDGKGRSLVGAPILDAMVVPAMLAESESESAQHVVLPAVHSRRAPGTLTGRAVAVDGVIFGDPQSNAMVVPTELPDGRTVRVDVDPADLQIAPVGGLDPDLGLHRVQGRLEGQDPDVGFHREVPWARILGVILRATAHELIGTARRMLSIAREHTSSRKQFGHPIATFQTVKHRLAEAYVAAEAAEALVDRSWFDERPVFTDAAKASAGEAAVTSAKHAQQVCGAMGFTSEFGLHRGVRRAYALDSLFKGSPEMTEKLGKDLRRRRDVPWLDRVVREHRGA